MGMKVRIFKMVNDAIILAEELTEQGFKEIWVVEDIETKLFVVIWR
jgi:hypothetical protein